MRVAMNQATETMPPTRAALIRDIEAFCSRHNLSPSAFGKMAASDVTLLNRLRGGGNVGIDRMDRIRKAMAEFEKAKR